MTKERAFWEALATVLIPNVVVWSMLAYVLRSHANSDEWPIYLILGAISLPLFFPIYYRYRKGVQLTKRLKWYWHVGFAVMDIGLAIEPAAPSLFGLRPLHDRGSWDVVLHLALAAVWLMSSVDQIRRAVEARACQSLLGQS